VAAHRIDLGDNCYIEVGIGFCGGDGRTQAGTPSADDEDIVLEGARHSIHSWPEFSVRTVIPESRS
jgi:hypothetical protein